MLHLAWGGLANVHVGGSLEMGGFDLGWVNHRSTPGWLSCVALTRRRERISRTARFCWSSNCSQRCVSGIGIPWKFRFSCGMALLACSRSYWQAREAAQESVGKIAEPQEVLERADQLRNLGGADGFPKIGPVGGDPRLTAVRQKEHELQAGGHAHLSEDLQRLPFEGMMRTRDRYAFGEVPMMGSVSYAPSTTSTMGG